MIKHKATFIFVIDIDIDICRNNNTYNKRYSNIILYFIIIIYNMLPTTKYGLMGVVVGVVLGSVAAGGYYWMSSSDKGSGTGTYTPTDAVATTYGGAKTKHNRNRKHTKKNKTKRVKRAKKTKRNKTKRVKMLSQASRNQYRSVRRLYCETKMASGR